MTILKKGLSGLLVMNVLLGGSFVVAPNADALQGLLFPFITTETGKLTFITIKNDGSGAFGGPPPNAVLHFTYAMKPVPILNRTACLRFDGDAGTTDVDMMIFEVSRKVVGPGGTTVLFEPGVSAPTTSLPVAFPSANHVGFLIVEITNRVASAFLFGTATVVDMASGLAFSYSTNFFTSSVSPNPDFSAIDGGRYSGGAPVGPGGVGFSGFKAASWYPTSMVTTSWFVLPLGDRSTMAPPGLGGIRLGLRTATDHVPRNAQGAYDLDERFFSGGKSVSVRCFGLITRSDFLQAAADVSTAGGGFTFLASNGSTVILPITDTQDPNGVYNPAPFMLFKVQSTSAFGSPKATMHQEPDHDPCFNSFGFFGPPGSC